MAGRTEVHETEQPLRAQGTGEHRARHVIVGVDGSEGSRAALLWASRIARAESAEIDAVLVWEQPKSYHWSGVPADLPWQEDADRVLTTTIDELFGRSRPPDLTLHVIRGDPARVLIANSSAALMVVVGSRGHGGFAGLLLGSVSTKVAELAHSPVLVVHGASPAGQAERTPVESHGAASDSAPVS